MDDVPGAAAGRQYSSPCGDGAGKLALPIVTQIARPGAGEAGKIRLNISCHLNFLADARQEFARRLWQRCPRADLPCAARHQKSGVTLPMMAACCELGSARRVSTSVGAISCGAEDDEASLAGESRAARGRAGRRRRALRARLGWPSGRKFDADMALIGDLVQDGADAAARRIAYRVDGSSVGDGVEHGFDGVGERRAVARDGSVDGEVAARDEIAAPWRPTSPVTMMASPASAREPEGAAPGSSSPMPVVVIKTLSTWPRRDLRVAGDDAHASRLGRQPIAAAWLRITAWESPPQSGRRRRGSAAWHPCRRGR